MLKNNRGSVLLVALTVMCVMFVLGFSLTYFTGSEEYSSAMSYESEVAFNLAESAVEEFIARLKNSLNHDDPQNQLYKVLRAYDTDVTKEIPLQPAQVANLTAYTRDTARQIYGIQFGRGLTDSKDFSVEAKLKMKHIAGVTMLDGETPIYKIKEDLKEKEADLCVTASVNYKGHEAKVTVTLKIRVVKTFVPPFNYFTLYVHEGSIPGGSKFNAFESAITQNQGLRLDNGWNAVKRDFDPTSNYGEWEKELALYGDKAITPPGRVYLGESLQIFSTLAQESGPRAAAIPIRSTNGAKLLYGEDLNSNVDVFTTMNAQENMFLNFDVPWTGMQNYVKKFMELQGQVKTKADLVDRIFKGGWGNDAELRVFNAGSGKEIISPALDGPPSFINCFQSFVNVSENRIAAATTDDEREMLKRYYPDPALSGFHPMGVAIPTTSGGKIQPLGGADFRKLSPTLIYGPVDRTHFRAVQLKTKKNKTKLELPYIDRSYLPMILDEKKGTPIAEDKEMTATEARTMFELSGVPVDHINKLIANWDDVPEDLKQFEKYENFMSNAFNEPYNKGLGHFLNRLKGEQKEYDGPLKDNIRDWLETAPYPYGAEPEGMSTLIRNDVTREFFEGPMINALPDPMETYRLDFYFMPRATEDFFRGRTTVAIGGVSFDRFEFKYINDVQAYRSNTPYQTLELNGILYLNDEAPLGLHNLKYVGHGIIYNSPMIGGGKVVIGGDLVGVDTDEILGTDSDEKLINGYIGKNMLTIIAPKIVIDTSYSKRSRCIVEANLISTQEPITIQGDKPITIKGTLVVPRLDISTDFPTCGENIIIYNALNGIWRNQMPALMDSLYVAKIVTGGVGANSFDWKYER